MTVLDYKEIGKILNTYWFPKERSKAMKKSASIGRTYNLGNYESLRMEIGFESSGDDELDEGELYQMCKETLTAWEKDQDVHQGRRSGK